MRKNNKKGFTLVELVIVVAVMAVLVAVAIPTIGSIKNAATDSVNKSNAKTIESIIKLAEADGTFDASGQSTISDSTIAQKIYEAKLGITKPASGSEPTFVYNKKTGVVTVGATTPSGDDASYCTISFTDANGKVSVKSKDATSASTYPTT